jgi:hypothetical protein
MQDNDVEAEAVRNTCENVPSLEPSTATIPEDDFETFL